MKNCRICIYSRVFVLGIVFAVIIVLLKDDLFKVFYGMSPLTISIVLILVFGVATLLKKLSEYFLSKNG